MTVGLVGNIKKFLLNSVLYENSKYDACLYRFQGYIKGYARTEILSFTKWNFYLADNLSGTGRILDPSNSYEFTVQEYILL